MIHKEWLPSNSSDSHTNLVLEFPSFFSNLVFGYVNSRAHGSETALRISGWDVCSKLGQLCVECGQWPPENHEEP